MRPLILTSILALWSTLCLADNSALKTQPRNLERVALLIGANDGGPDRIPLQYAVSDARALRDVLTDLGGVDPVASILLENPSSAQLNRSLRLLQDLVEQRQLDGDRTEIFLYYSGHSDENGLLLGKDRYRYIDLRTQLQQMDANVKVAILDSCASGAFTQLKGGKRLAPFLSDDGTDIRGHAFLTSSSADEASQESDTIGASFFTHYLVAGLRGAADNGGDGKVTLNEAYQYAFQETLQRTEGTLSGAQHPNYDIQLSGTGDLVMTDLRDTSASIAFPAENSGKVFIRNQNGKLIVELNKQPGQAMTLGIPPDTYLISVHQTNDWRRGQVVVADNQTNIIDLQALPVLPAEKTIARGNTSSTTVSTTTPVSTPTYKELVFGLSIAGKSTAAERTDRVQRHLSLNILYGRYHKLLGAEISLFGSYVHESRLGLQLALLGFNSGGGSLTGAGFSPMYNLARDSLIGLQVSPGINRVAGNAIGLQVGGSYNGVSGTLQGGQIGILNTAGSVHGLQVGIVNIGGNLAGTQIGLVNIASNVRGAQIGLVNYARDISGASIAPFNFVRKGVFQPFVFWERFHTLGIGLRMGGARFHTIYVHGLRVHPLGNRYRYLSTGLGLGGRVHITKGFTLDPDLIVFHVNNGFKYFDGSNNALAQLWLNFTWQPGKHFGLFVAPNLSVLWTGFQDTGSLDHLAPTNRPLTANIELGPGASPAAGTNLTHPHKIQIWPGVAAGLSF